MKFSPLFVLALSSAAFSTPLRRALPTPVDVATAKTYLSQLVVAEDSNVPAYKRTLFKTWDIVSGKCDTRETVIKRDGTNVATNSACSPTTGNWVSPYDNVGTTHATDLDVDFLVPLKEAWVSGARNWLPSQREAFANDMTRPQLITVSVNMKQAKADKDVTNWLPPSTSYVCTYTQAWITVKQFYALTIDSAEKTTLTNLLNTC